jgi:CTP synthase (UTP-ammonia lyase)
MSTTIGVELPAHPFILATLFVPTIQIGAERPHPIFTAFLKAGQRNVIKHDRV